MFEPNQRARSITSSEIQSDSMSEETGRFKRTVSITPTLALSEGPLLSTCSLLSNSKTDSGHLTSDKMASSIDSNDDLMKIDSEGKKDDKNVQQKLLSVTKSLRSETLLRREMENHCKKLQNEKLALESYLQKLPSLSEFQQMQTDLELQSITHNKLSHQIQDIRQELEKKSSQLSNSQREVLNLKLQVENFQSDLGNERSRSQRVQFASEASTSQTEKALEEHEKLVQEKKKLMKYIVVTKSKTEKELGSLQKQLQAEKEQTSFLSSRVDILSESQAEAENTSKHLREQLEASFGKVSDLETTISDMESEKWKLQKSELVDRASDRCRLTKKLKSSVEEFENLSSTLCQMLNGEDDLDVCRLLGVDLSSSEITSTNKEVSIDDFYQELFRVEQVLSQSTNELRDKVSNHYAENIAANNSNCITQ